MMAPLVARLRNIWIFATGYLEKEKEIHVEICRCHDKEDIMFINNQYNPILPRKKFCPRCVTDSKLGIKNSEISLISIIGPYGNTLMSVCWLVSWLIGWLVVLFEAEFLY